MSLKLGRFGGTWASLLSNFLLLIIGQVRCLLAFWCQFFVMLLMVDLGMLILFMVCLCMDHVTLVVMAKRGLTFHLLYCMVILSTSYLVCLMAYFGYLLWYYVSSTNLSVCAGEY